jgi:hypothetical protein
MYDKVGLLKYFTSSEPIIINALSNKGNKVITMCGQWDMKRGPHFTPYTGRVTQIISDLILLGGVLPVHLNSLMPEVQPGRCGETSCTYNFPDPKLIFIDGYH